MIWQFFEKIKEEKYAGRNTESTLRSSLEQSLIDDILMGDPHSSIIGKLAVLYWATLKKKLFPVQRVAEIVSSRAAAISFFFCKKNVEIFDKKKTIGKMKKKKFPFCSYILTRPLDWKQHFF